MINLLLKIRKYILKAKSGLFHNLPFEIAHTECKKNNKYANPDNCKTVLAKFNADNKHWIIYKK